MAIRPGRGIEYTSADGRIPDFTKTLYLSHALQTLVRTNEDMPEPVRRLFADLFSCTPQGVSSLLRRRDALFREMQFRDEPVYADELIYNFYHIEPGTEESATITVLPYGRTCYTGARDYWLQGGRQTLRPGVFLRRLFTEQVLSDYGIDDSAVEAFANVCKAALKPTFEFRVSRGDDIVNWYRVSSYKQGGGSLNKSCMRHLHIPEDTFDLYVKSPVVSMLIAVSARSRLVGRALIWEGVKVSLDEGEVLADGVTFMDRVFTQSDHLTQFFFDYAQEAGYWRKGIQSASSQTQLYNPQAQRKFVGRVEVRTGLKASDVRNMPYMDTFKYSWEDEGELVMGNVQNMSGMVSTPHSGWIPASRVAHCAYCEMSGDRNRMYVVGAWPSNAHLDLSQRAVLCNRCASRHYIHSNLMNGYVPRTNSVMVSNSMGPQDWVTTEQAVYSKMLGAQIFAPRAVYLRLEDDYAPDTDSRIRFSDAHNTYINTEKCIDVPEVGWVYTYLLRDTLSKRGWTAEDIEALEAQYPVGGPQPGTLRVAVPAEFQYQTGVVYSTNPVAELPPRQYTLSVSGNTISTTGEGWNIATEAWTSTTVRRRLEDMEREIHIEQ